MVTKALSPRGKLEKNGEIYLGIVAKWDSALHSEWDGSWFESHWCTQPSTGSQPRYEAPSNLQGKLWIALWLTLGEEDCIPASDTNLPLGNQIAVEKEK